MTVSRVINNKGEVSEPTRKRVLAVIEKLNYRPSGIARGLATHHIGVASQSCGACGSGGPAELCLAMDAVVNGDALRERESSNADLAAAVQYGQAVSRALEAAAGCS